jgi:hypothetical protein
MHVFAGLSVVVVVLVAVATAMVVGGVLVFAFLRAVYQRNSDAIASCVATLRFLQAAAASILGMVTLSWAVLGSLGVWNFDDMGGTLTACIFLLAMAMLIIAAITIGGGVFLVTRPDPKDQEMAFSHLTSVEIILANFAARLTTRLR